MRCGAVADSHIFRASSITHVAGSAVISQQCCSEGDIRQSLSPSPPHQCAPSPSPRRFLSLMERHATSANLASPQLQQPGLPPSRNRYSYTPTTAVSAAPTPSDITSRAAGLAISSPPAHHARMEDHDGDMPMIDDADPYNQQKYAAQQQRPTAGAQRMSQQYRPTQQPQSTAAERYSPMHTSPTTSSYTPQQSQQYASFTPQQQQQQHSARQSPSRAYASPSQQQRGYSFASPSSASRAQLPPLQSTLSPVSSSHYPQSATQQLNAVFGTDVHSPPTPSQPQRLPPGDKGPVPTFTRNSTLRPRINAQPPFRRAHPEGGFISPLQALTTHLPATYRICNPAFQYSSTRNPRRVLTKPSKGVKNDGYDNEDSDYILYVNDILGSEETNHKTRYLILDVLGQGTFGQVVKCQNLKTQEVVAVKVVKNKTAYFNQSMMEVSVLDLLNGRMDRNDDHHILRLKDTFIHRQHLCLVFELLSVNLYELIKQNQFRGLSTTLVRVFAQQLLNGLCLLGKARLVHCDLKPENILLKK